MGLMVLASPFVHTPITRQPDAPSAKKAFNLIKPDIVLKEKRLPLSEQENVISNSFRLQEKLMQSTEASDVKLQKSFKKWLSQFDSAADKSLFEKVKFVNKLVNRTTTYKTDYELSGKYSYSPAVAETVSAPVIYADCEDYALQKYYALLHLGVEQERMAIVAVNLEIAGKPPKGHAVLAVDTSRYRTKRNCVILNSGTNTMIRTNDDLTRLIEYKHNYKIRFTSSVRPDKGVRRIFPVQRKPQVLAHEIKKPR